MHFVEENSSTAVSVSSNPPFLDLGVLFMIYSSAQVGWSIKKIVPVKKKK